MIDETWYQRPPNVGDRTSAGGVVVRCDSNGTILIALIREQLFPDFVLPKGGVEPGETLEQAARREVEEESGLRDLTLIQSLGQLERLSFDKALWITTHFFLFHTHQIDGIPTDSAHHHGVWWFPIDALPTIFWPDQQEFIKAHCDRIRDSFAGQR